MFMDRSFRITKPARTNAEFALAGTTFWVLDSRDTSRLRRCNLVTPPYKPGSKLIFIERRMRKSSSVKSNA